MIKSPIIIPRAGELGIISDLPPLMVPPNAWTSGVNVRVNDGELVAFPGHDLGGENTGLDAIWSLTTVTDATSHYWVNLGDDGTGVCKAFAYDGTTFHDISPTPTPANDFTGARADIITHAFLNGRLVTNNLADVPHTWDLSTGNDYVPLVNWDSNWRAKAIAAFKGFLVAINITDSGAFSPNRVKWSDEAVPGALPGSWDETDPTTAAGEYDLADTTAALVAIKALRNELVLYTERECFGMALVGGSLIWRFRLISSQTGAMTPRAVGAFKGLHAVMTDNDLVVNDGQNIRSIGDGRNKRYMFRQLDESNYGYAFTQVHRLRDEVWFCFPSAGNDFCDMSLVWNRSEDTFGVRELPPGCISAADGTDIVGLSTATWETGGAAATWNLEDGAWDERAFNALGGLLLLAGDNTNTGMTGAPVYRADQGNTFNGDLRQFRVERLAMNPDPAGRVLTVTEVWVEATGDPVTVRIGYQNAPNGPVFWKSAQTFDPELDKKLTCRVTGRYPCLALESLGDFNTRIHGVRLMFVAGAER